MNNRRKQLMLASAKEYCKCVVEGKTLKYNQIVKNGNFNGTSEWTSSAGTFSVSDNICSFDATAQNGDIRTIVYYDIVVGHKYLVYAEIKTTTATNNGVALYFGYSSPDRIGYVPSNTEWNAVCGIKQATAQGNSYLVFIRDFRASNRDTIYIKNVMCIDLTMLGLESITNASDFFATDLGKYIAKGNYLPYEPEGKFIHAQSPINFKGVNIWNEQWDNGYYSTGTKTLVSDSGWICSKSEIKVTPNTQYYFSCSYYNVIYFFNDDTYIDSVICSNNSFTTPSNCNNIVFMTNTSAYHNDICINLYNVNYNGKYYKYCSNSVFESGLTLQKGDTYKSWNGNLTRTMKEIDLSTLTWTWEGDYWDADISNIDDIKKYYQSDEVPNAIAEKYKVVSVNQDAQEGYPIGNLIIEGSEFSGYYIEINSNDSQNAPTGKMLIELLQPTLVMWQTLDIENYNEFVEIDPHIYKLNRDLSDYGVLDVTSDTGTKQSNLTMLNIAGGYGDFCYQDGYIYQKTNDIESVWIYQIQISNAPSRMVSRRTINVESENGIDMDFTKQ